MTEAHLAFVLLRESATKVWVSTDATYSSMLKALSPHFLHVTAKKLLLTTNDTSPSNHTNLDSVWFRAIRLHS